MQQYDQLVQAFKSPNSDPKTIKAILQGLKPFLLQVSYLSANTLSLTTEHQKSLAIARDILEIAALVSIRSKEMSQFQRYYSQLSVFYNDYQSFLPTSSRMFTLLGLHLLSLLAENRLSEFHAYLERINPELLLTNIYIKHPVQLEQCLMEGSYNKVWNAKTDVPAQEYSILMEILMETIRNEIADSAQVAYQTLPIKDALGLLHFKDINLLKEFINKRNWKVVGDLIKFGSGNDEVLGIPSERVIKETLKYAREIEKIV